MRDNPEKYEKWELGNAKIMASFGAKGFKAGYSGIRNGREKKTRYKCSLANLKKQIPLLKGINFTSLDYRELIIDDGSLVYCDPPYRNVTGYQGRKFSYEEYDNWVRQLSQRCYVVCSEYSMPDDFICIKEIPKHQILPKDENSKLIYDRLFICKNGLLKSPQVDF